MIVSGVLLWVVRQTAIPVGGAIGTGLFPWLAYSYGFEVTFLALAVIGLTVGFAVLFFINSKQNEFKNERTSTLTVSPLKSADVWKVVIAAGFLTVPQMAVLTFGGVYMRGCSRYQFNFDLYHSHWCSNRWWNSQNLVRFLYWP